jgi:hypothetical protein
VFEHQTVRSLAARAGFDQLQTLVEQPAAEGPCLLLPIQQAFFAADPVERHHWNQSLLLQPRQPLDAAVLEQALLQLWRHHDVLRSCFSQGAQGWQAHIPAADEPPAALLWQRHCATPEELEPLLNQAQRSFDLARGDVLRAVLATLPDGSQRLLLTAHHLVVDGVSWRILLEDLQACHDALQAGAATPAGTQQFGAALGPGTGRLGASRAATRHPGLLGGAVAAARPGPAADAQPRTCAQRRPPGRRHAPGCAP